LIAKFVNENK